MALHLTSPAFQNGTDIPLLYTCDGKDISPELNWNGAPEGTQSFVLICDDPDVPEMLREKVPSLVWDHWALFNIPATVTSIPEGALQGPKGSVCGKNSWGRNDYGGPCPPNPKPHRYFFKLYALDVLLTLPKDADKEQILKAMNGHVLAETELMGIYLRKEFR